MVFEYLDPVIADSSLKCAQLSNNPEELRSLEAWAWRTACFEVLLLSRYRLKVLQSRQDDHSRASRQDSEIPL